MKSLKWFKTGEAIPLDAHYVKTETRTISTWDENATCSAVSEDFHLYEIKLDTANRMGMESA